MIESIKSRLSCTDYLQRHGVYVKSGGRCVSPLRAGAKNPTSFYCTESKWYDFGTASGGDVIDLCAIMEYGGDVGEAIRSLASELGIKQDHKYDNYKQDIQALCNRTAAYHAALTVEDYQYLSARGVTHEDAERLLIGRVTDGYLKGRLFLPYVKNGAVVYYATRAMPGGAHEESKYMKASLSECESYQHVPWGLHTLNRGNDLLVISEGYFDAVSWEREGYAVLSPITGAFSSSQWGDVIDACRMFKRVLVIFDNDAISHAGEGFTARTSQRLFNAGIPFLVAHTPQGIKDVNDYYAGGGSLQALVDSAQDGLKYMVQKFRDISELKNFIMSIHRTTDKTLIASALASCSDRFSNMELKTIQKAAEAAPTESQIVDDIINKHNIIYVDHDGFYEWSGRVWQKVSDSIVQNYADKLYGKFFSTANRVKAVCSLLKSRTICDIAFDRKPVVTFLNGTLEIETGNFRSHSEQDYCSICLDFEYNAEAQCPTWCNFITDVTDDCEERADTLQTIAGYVLFPNCPHQRVFILNGKGGNGKSVYLEVIQRLFGDQNTTHVEPSGLPDSFQRILLKDSMLNIGSDINSDFTKGEIREWLLKIADGTSVQACYKGKDNINFVPRCKLIYACNSIPSADVVNGLSRRFLFIDFPCMYVETPDPSKPKQKRRDINLLPKLLEELPGIFNWAYAGYKLLRTVGYFTEPPEHDVLMKQFETVSNPVSVFCDDHDFDGEMSRQSIYNVYKEWCEDTGHRPLSREKFFPKFCECMGEKILDPSKQVRRNGTRCRVVVFGS